ncbi:MAG: hypothetical protein AABX37_06315 [Nanoarchaeota archaeon]
MNAPFNRCVECEEVITNPICADCLADHMNVMLLEHDPNLKDVVQGAKIEGNTICISCGQGMGLCAHCFSKDVYLFLKEQNSPAAEQFLAYFDFELREEFLQEDGVL